MIVVIVAASEKHASQEDSSALHKDSLASQKDRHVPQEDSLALQNDSPASQNDSHASPTELKWKGATTSIYC
jgi:hypothetical protein